MRIALALVLAACSSSAAHDPAAPDATDGDAATGDSIVAAGQPKLPSPTGACPAIVAGDVTFAPAGMPPRKVKLALADPAPAPGPLVIYWHATYSSPDEAAYSLGATEDAITARGGVVAAPYPDPAAGMFEWFIVNGSVKTDDFVLADEIVACLVASGRIDPLRIHSMGMSAGGLQTTATSFLRSDYIASVATYSGGMPDGFSPAMEDPTNKFAALIFSGGASDNVFGVDFQAASERYRTTLAASGHFTEACDHGQGHQIPLDAAPSVDAFFTANPYGAWPSPYTAGIPSSFPAYCAR
jgi:predicted esterase